MAVVVVLRVILLLDVAGCHRSIAFAMTKRCRPRCGFVMLWQHNSAIGRQSVAYHTTQSLSASEQLCIWCMSRRFTIGNTLQSSVSLLVMHRCLQRELTVLLCWMDSGCTCLLCPVGATIDVLIVVALMMRCQSSCGFVCCVGITIWLWLVEQLSLLHNSTILSCW